MKAHEAFFLLDHSYFGDYENDNQVTQAVI